MQNYILLCLNETGSLSSTFSFPFIFLIVTGKFESPIWTLSWKRENETIIAQEIEIGLFTESHSQHFMIIFKRVLK